MLVMMTLSIIKFLTLKLGAKVILCYLMYEKLRACSLVPALLQFDICQAVDRSILILMNKLNIKIPLLK